MQLPKISHNSKNRTGLSLFGSSAGSLLLTLSIVFLHSLPSAYAETCLRSKDLLASETTTASGCSVVQEMFILSRDGENEELLQYADDQSVMDEHFSFWTAQFYFSVLEFYVEQGPLDSGSDLAKKIQSRFRIAYYDALETANSPVERQIKYLALLALEEKFFGARHDATFWPVLSAPTVDGIEVNQVMAICLWRNHLPDIEIEEIYFTQKVTNCRRESIYGDESNDTF